MDGLRVGDQVELTGEITSLYEDGGSCQPGAVLHFGACSCWIDMKTVRTGRRVARPLAVGDQAVIVQSGLIGRVGRSGQIVAIHGPEAWLDGIGLELFANLGRTPAPDTKEGTT